MVVPPQALVLSCYRIPFSTNVERVALAAGHKSVPIEWIDVDPDDRSPVEEASGQPLVPVLLTCDEVISDSPRILDGSRIASPIRHCGPATRHAVPR